MIREYIRYPRRPPVLVALLIIVLAAAFSITHGFSTVDGAAVRSESSGSGTVTLTCVFIDAAGADTLAARCSVTDCNGSPRYPPLGVAFYHIPDLGYFYADGSFSISIPPGVTTIRVSRGPAYGTVVRSVAVLGDTTVVIALERVVDMEGCGWYGGDTHVHLDHDGGYYLLDPADAHMMARAEGLNIVTCLDNEFYFTGGPDACSTPRCIIYMSEERRTTGYGDIALLGLSHLIVPFSTDWSPLAAESCDSAHTQAGACVVAAHPVTTDDFWDVGGWPGVGLGRELPVDVTRNRIDCIEVMSYSNCHNGGIELELWYRLLNCGFTLPPCAGTDACMNRLDSYPLGEFRTYAHVGADSLTYDRWLEAVKAGRTFITNGPFITAFTVAGRTMGETVFLGHGCAEVVCTVSIVCVSPIERAEIVMNGSVIRTFPIGGERYGIDTSFTLPVDRSAWLAARVHGVNTHWLPVRDSLFAHTSPIYISMGGERILRPDDASYFVDWISNLETLARGSGYWPHMIDSVLAFDEFAAAKQYYTMLSDVTTAVGESGDLPPPVLFLEQNVPNPFAGGTVIGFGLARTVGAEHRDDAMGGETADLCVFDVRGRLIRRLLNRPIRRGPMSVYWDGADERGRHVASGIYFCRLRIGTRSRSTKMILVR